jgi:hypothetical protein
VLLPVRCLSRRADAGAVIGACARLAPIKRPGQRPCHGWPPRGTQPAAQTPALAAEPPIAAVARTNPSSLMTPRPQRAITAAIPPARPSPRQDRARRTAIPWRAARTTAWTFTSKLSSPARPADLRAARQPGAPAPNPRPVGTARAATGRHPTAPGRSYARNGMSILSCSCIPGTPLGRWSTMITVIGEV